MTIALALSGGGVRATVFHLGVLARLARQSLIEKVTFLSTVSGGSLAVSLVWACSGNSWPDSDALLRCTIPAARRLLTAHGLHGSYVRYMLLSPWVLRCLFRRSCPPIPSEAVRLFRAKSSTDSEASRPG